LNLLTALVEPLAVAWHAANRLPIENGDDVLVLGAGPIGLGIIQCLKVKGANIIVSEVAQRRQRFAKDFGAAHVLNPQTDDVVKTVKELCGGVGPKVAFDCAGEYGDIITDP
jgi:threonine dehydrogenase-like Zn-dependent dehydrogenase